MAWRKLYKHIFKGFIAVTLVFTILFAVAFSISSYGAMKGQFEAEAEEALGQFVKQTDIRLSMVKEMASRLSQDAAVAAYAQSGETEGTIALVQESIRKNMGSSAERGMRVYVSRLASSLEHVVGAEQVTSVYDFLSAYQFGNGASEGIRQYFTRSENEGKVFVRYCMDASSGNTNSLFVVARAAAGAQYVYVMCVLDVSALLGGQVYRGGSVAILDGQDIVCNIGANTFATTNGIHDITGRNGSGVMLQQAVYGEGYLYRAAASDIYRWTYVMAVPTGALGDGAVQIVFSALILCVLWLLLCWGLLRLFAKWVYRPVDTVLKCMPGYYAGLSDEAVFVAQAVASMAQERDELAKKLETAKDPLREKFMRDLLFGLVSGEEAHEQAAVHGLAQLPGPYRVVLVEFADYELLQEAFPEESIREIKRQIEEFINDQLRGQVAHGAIRIDRTRMAVLSYGTEVRALRELLMDMAMMVEGSFDVEIACAIGDDCEKLTEIEQSYQSACHIMENRVSIGSRSAVVTSEDVNVANAGGFYYPLNAERELITAVIRAHTDETDRILDSVLEENFKNRTLTKERMNAFAFAITATLNRILESLGKTAEEVFGEGDIVFLDLKMCREPGELGAKIRELFHKIIEHIDMENKMEEDDLASQMLDYIHSHYNEDISLLDIGGHFNLSQCYTSTLFKDATGENFKDYLSRYRIKKAKEILAENPGIKNNELAKMIGCNTVATLFRLFNKYEGMSPGQYVKSRKAQ